VRPDPYPHEMRLRTFFVLFFVLPCAFFILVAVMRHV
jgi:hypothetical protein